MIDHQDQACTQISMRESKQSSCLCILPFWQSRHSHSSVHFSPARQHSQQFLRHSDFLQVQRRMGTKAGMPLKVPGCLKLAICWALQIQNWQLALLQQQTHRHFSLQSRRFEKHSQYILRQSILVHLQPGWDWDCWRGERLRVVMVRRMWLSCGSQASSMSRSNRSLQGACLRMLSSSSASGMSLSEPEEEEEPLDRIFKF